jgi:sRNA-binding carbon storage regulator CsrA
MLVLKQRRGEVIVIGEAHIHVLRISDEWVELGITAPSAWAITRELTAQGSAVPDDNQGNTR